MVDIQKLAKSVLDKSRLMSLATTDDGGLWVADVQFYSDNKFNIYWTSSRDVRHSKAIRINPQVAASITFNLEDRSQNFGIQLAGNAMEIPEGRFSFVEEYKQKFGYERKRPNTEFLGLDTVWYQIKPTKMELIYEPEFGFSKREVQLES